jgi:transcriptional regulator with XRE-family HTH domain
MAGPGSAVARRQLGKRLQKMRQLAGKSLEEVEAALRVSASKVSRIENGKVPVKLTDARELARLYGADEGTVAAIGQLALGTNTAGYWESYGDLVVPDWFGLYVGLEYTASAIRTFDVELLHGLLQTEEYARALYIGSAVAFSPEDINKNVAFRFDRQRSVFGREDVLDLQVTVSAGALERQVGGRTVMRNQVAHLLELEERGLATIRVLPFRAGTLPIQRAFSLIDFNDEEDPSTAYVEVPGGARYMEEDDELDYYRTAWSALLERSVPLREHAK